MRDLILSIKGHDRCRPYAHFDRRVSLDRCAEKVTSPEYVSKHSFFPLIENDQRRMKKDENGNITKPISLLPALPMKTKSVFLPKRLYLFISN